jgi:hypothetical protein
MDDKPDKLAPREADSCFEDIERPMLRRIRELKNRVAADNPERHVRDVEATGSCFFLCGNLARQDLGLSARTSSDEQLRKAADTDRLSVLALMLERLEMPMNDGMLIKQKLALVALVKPFRGPPPRPAHVLMCHNPQCELSTCEQGFRRGRY